MTLPTSGNPLSLSQIQTEFGGDSSTGTSLSEYYAGGAYVPAGTVGYPNGISTAIPSSPLAISIANFFGASAAAVSSLLTFTTSQTWTVPTGVFTIKMLVIAGGGGGGSGLSGQGYPEAGGGGGAGGGILTSVLAVQPGDVISMTMGAGGAGGYNSQGSNGANTAVVVPPAPSAIVPVSRYFTAIGGGYGGTYANGQPYETQQFGGSGGSGGGANSAWYTDHAGGNQPGQGTVGQGHNGSVGSRGTSSGCGGGYGTAATNTQGGAGATLTLLTTPITFGGGGGGGGSVGRGASEGGGVGGGPGVVGITGTVFTGGGGGGGGTPTAATVFSQQILTTDTYLSHTPIPSSLYIMASSNIGSGQVDPSYYTLTGNLLSFISYDTLLMFIGNGDNLTVYYYASDAPATLPSGGSGGSGIVYILTNA